MITIYQRTWKRRSGSIGKAWRVEWTDRQGDEASKQFPTKTEAEAFKLQLQIDLVNGTDVDIKRRVSFLEVAQQWVDRQEGRAKREEIERSTWLNQRGHLQNHLAKWPKADIMISELRPLDYEGLKERLLELHGVRLTRAVMVTVRAICKFATLHGAVGANHAAGIQVRAPRLDRAKAQRVPERGQLLQLARAVLGVIEEEGSDGPSFMQAYNALRLFTGLRPSEARGLLDHNLVLTGDRPRVKVALRADPHGRLGPCKSAAAYRSVDLPAEAVAILKRWMLKCGPTQEDIRHKYGGRLVFPNEAGKPYNESNIRGRYWVKLMEQAGLADVTPADKATGTRKKVRPHFLPNDLRHAAASLWIEAGLDAKAIMEKMGHSSIQLTYDTYGHLFRDRWAGVNTGDIIAIALGLRGGNGAGT